MEVALAAQRLAVLVGLAWLVVPLASVHRPPGAPRVPRPLRVFADVVGLGFVLVLGCNLLWALTPELDPGFQTVQQFDARPWRLRTVDDRRGVTDRRGVALIKNELSGGQVVRRYPLGAAASHLTGYHHRRFGQAGLEAAANELLSTWRQPSWAILQQASQSKAPLHPPLRLTLEAKLQQVAAKGLGQRNGAAVVLDPATGEVLALVSSPGFNPETLGPADFQRARSGDRQPLLNRALDGLYPPGSTFKPVVAAAALAQPQRFGLGTVHETPPEGFCPPGDSKPIQDHEASEAARTGEAWAGHGPIDMRKALAVSSNGYFGWLGCELGGPALLAAAQACRLDASWRLVRGEGDANALTCKPGHLPAQLTSPADVARFAIGQQELLLTPLHLALLAGTIGNDGVLVPPHLLADDAPARGVALLTPALARQVKGLMRCAVTDRAGTARGLRLGQLAVAAKTGSAENSAGAPHAWVIAVAPYERPRLALAVVVEHGGQGARAAVPIARNLLQAAAGLGWCMARGAAHG